MALRIVLQLENRSCFIAANIARLPELLGTQPKPDANPLFHRRPT